MTALIGLATFATEARAVEYTIDFGTGPPVGESISDQYLGAAFVQWFQSDPGFRPARRSSDGGDIVADVGASRCGPDGGGSGNDCEFPTGGTVFNLSKTATSASMEVGLIESTPFGAVNVQLQAFTAGGQAVASSPVTPIAYNAPPAAFGTTITVAGTNIQKILFVLSGPGAQGASVGFDDLVLDYPPGQVPDIGLSGPLNTSVVQQGGSTDVPITIVRVNGSNGNLTGSVGGLPPGVTATLVPDPVGGTAGSAALRVSASATAEVDFAGDPITLTLTPADANVAPEPRTLILRISVRAPFSLFSPASSGRTDVPACAPVDVPMMLAREASFAASETVTLSAVTPPNMTAEFLPGTTIGPGPSSNADFTLRLTRPDNVAYSLGTVVEVRASAPGRPNAVLRLPVAAAAATAAVDPATPSGSVPTAERSGALVRLTGNGFCPGTSVTVGNAKALVTPEIDPGLTSLSFRVPRLATPGPISVDPPIGPPYAATPDFTVQTPRKAYGFQFDNPGWGNLSFGELTDLVGVEEMFLSVNPCWPVYDCSIPTPIPDPIAYAKWQAVEQAAQSSGGHCFGITRFVQEVQGGRITTARFGASTMFALGSRNGPGGALGSYLDHRHAGQFTAEFIAAYLSRDESISNQIAKIRSDLASNRRPGLVLKPGLFSGHVVTVHDVEFRPDGTTILHLYDNEYPYRDEEDSDRGGGQHEAAELASSVTINAAKTSWTYGSWTGDSDGFMATSLNSFPGGTSPHLPGLSAITGAIIFGSAGGAARSEGPPSGAELLPALDVSAPPGAAGTVIAENGAPLTHAMTGVKDGAYRQTYMAGDFLGSVSVPTAKGVEDSFTADAGEVAFEGSETRPLELRVGTDAGATSRLATIDTRTSAGGSDSAALAGGGVVYEHAGPATKVSFTLESVTRGKGASTFRSGPIAVRRGQTLRVKPDSWTSLRRVRVNGRRVRNRGGRLRTRVALSGLAVRRGRARVTLRTRRVPAGAVAGVVLRLGSVARKTFSVAKLRAGKRTFSFRPRGVAPGVYRLRADAIVSAVGARTGRARARRSARVRL